MPASIALNHEPAQQYLLRLADACLVLSQRLAEWCGHAPVLEEDIALANMALDLLGQARALLAHAGAAQGHDEDHLAFLRDEADYRNPTLMELPRGDFAFTVLRNLVVSTWLKLLWERLQRSSDDELAAIAAKAVKEARYHQQHAADWAVRLGDGSDESAQRMRAACAELWPYTAELFDADDIDAQAVAAGLGPSWADLHGPWWAELAPVLAEARLDVPAATPFRSHGKRGRHSEHMGYLLAEMQHLQRSFPGGGVVIDGTALDTEARTAAAWAVLDAVLDPEVPALSLTDLGIVRNVSAGAAGVDVVLTPTYSGCPATEAIERSVVEALGAAGLGPVRVSLQRAPAWTTDWISDEGRRKLRDYGIAPPAAVGPGQGAPMRFVPRRVACPRCASTQTEQLSAFGATACKSLWSCLACLEPFEHFKPI